jgi:hypothetical protein
VYGNLTQQETIVNIYSELLDIRENLKQMWANIFNRCLRKFTADVWENLPQMCEKIYNRWLPSAWGPFAPCSWCPPTTRRPQWTCDAALLVSYNHCTCFVLDIIDR